MKVCPICGKLFACQPEFWPYRRGNYYLCRENCMIVFDVREFREKTGWIEEHDRRKKQMKKVTLEQKKKAVEIAIGGGDPLKFLEECGSANPSAHWYYIKKTLKEKDPETYALLMAPEEPKVKLTIDSEELAEIAGKPEEPDEVKEEPMKLPEQLLNEIKEPWNYMKQEEPAVLHRVQAVALDDDFEIYGLKTKAGDFQTAAGNLCWTFDGFQMNLPVERWRQLIETVPKVLNVMKL